jgi:hypothetical protein
MRRILFALILFLVGGLVVWSQLPTVVSGTVPFSATATDAGSGVAQVEFFVDGISIGTDLPDGDSDYTAPLDTTQFADGPHTLTATARDNAGNEASDSKNVVFDNDPPSISITGP